MGWGLCALQNKQRKAGAGGVRDWLGSAAGEGEAGRESAARMRALHLGWKAAAAAAGDHFPATREPLRGPSLKIQEKAEREMEKRRPRRRAGACSGPGERHPPSLCQARTPLGVNPSPRKRVGHTGLGGGTLFRAAQRMPCFSAPALARASDWLRDGPAFRAPLSGFASHSRSSSFHRKGSKRPGGMCVKKKLHRKLAIKDVGREVSARYPKEGFAQPLEFIPCSVKHLEMQTSRDAIAEKGFEN